MIFSFNPAQAENNKNMIPMEAGEFRKVMTFADL